MQLVEESPNNPVTPSPRHLSSDLWKLRHRELVRALHGHKSNSTKVTGVDATSSPCHPLGVPFVSAPQIYRANPLAIGTRAGWDPSTYPVLEALEALGAKAG